MRRTIVPVVVVAALMVAAPAFAQRVSLADRVAALEQRASDSGSSNIDMLNQIEQLRTEVVSLRSLIEELQQQNEQLRASGRDQYLDIDGRLNRLESGALPDPEALPDPAAGAAPVPSAPASGAAPDTRQTLVQAMGEQDEREAYDTAFAALRAGEYGEAAWLFSGFLEAHPQAALTPNALYWLGESHYVSQDYVDAKQRFRELIERFPDDSRAPGALLKVGLSQYGQQRLDEAEKTLASVASRYPGSDAARTADDRLRAIRLSRLR